MAKTLHRGGGGSDDLAKAGKGRREWVGRVMGLSVLRIVF